MKVPPRRDLRQLLDNQRFLVKSSDNYVKHLMKGDGFTMHHRAKTRLRSIRRSLYIPEHSQPESSWVPNTKREKTMMKARILVGIGIGAGIALAGAAPALADHDAAASGGMDYTISTCTANCSPDAPPLVKQNPQDALSQQIANALSTPYADATLLPQPSTTP